MNSKSFRILSYMIYTIGHFKDLIEKAFFVTCFCKKLSSFITRSYAFAYAKCFKICFSIIASAQNMIFSNV